MIKRQIEIADEPRKGFLDFLLFPRAFRIDHKNFCDQKEIPDISALLFFADGIKTAVLRLIFQKRVNVFLRAGNHLFVPQEIGKGVLRFREAEIDVEVKEGEYYIQKAGLKQEGVEPSDEPNYFFIHFKGHFSHNGLPLHGTFNIEEAQKIIAEIEKLGNTAEKLDYDSLFYLLLRLLRRENAPRNARGAHAQLSH